MYHAIRSTLHAIRNTKHFVRIYKRNMQNKPNLQDAQMNVSTYYTKVYKNETASYSGKNKPNSNPIRQACVVCEGVAGLNKPNPSGLRCLRRSCRTDQTQLPKGPNECKLNFNKGLQKKR